MTDSHLAIEERHDGNVTVLTLTGEITLDDGDLRFRKCIHDLIDQGHTQVVADLAHVTYIDSSGVGMLVAKMKTLRERGGDLRLARLSRRGERLFGMLKLLIAFETFDDVAAATRSFASRR